MEYKNIHRDIVEGCLTGNRLAQQKLYQLYSQAMHNICLRMLNNETDAEDLLQNSFVDVFTKLHYFRFDSSIGAWIKRIVINNCINFLKKKRLKTVEIIEQAILHRSELTMIQISWFNAIRLTNELNLDKAFDAVYLPTK